MKELNKKEQEIRQAVEKKELEKRLKKLQLERYEGNFFLFFFSSLTEINLKNRNVARMLTRN